jgi:hypothetical protein
MITKKKLYITARRKLPFNYKTELEDLSLRHTETLAEACLNFIEESMVFQNTLINYGMTANELSATLPFFHPFSSRQFTRPAFLMACFLAFALKHEVAAIAFEHIGRKKAQMSLPEITWISWCMFNTDTKKYIHENGISTDTGQHYFGKGYPVPDNYIDSACYFFQGCMYHGCICKQELKGPNFLFKGKTLSQRDEEGRVLMNKLSVDFNCEVYYQRECEFKKLRNYPKFIHWRKEHPYLHPGVRMIPRDSVFGSYTELFRNKWDFLDGGTFHVDDARSFYPQCATGLFPIGNFKVLMENEFHTIVIANNNILVNGIQFTGIVFLRIVSRGLNQCCQAFRLKLFLNFS